MTGKIGACDLGRAALVAAGATKRVSVGPDGAQANGGIYGTAPSISADGRFVAFLSRATDLVPGDTNGASDVFVHHR